MNIAEVVDFVYKTIKPLPNQKAQEKRLEAALALAQELEAQGWTFEVRIAQNEVWHLICITPMITFSGDDLSASSRYEIRVTNGLSNPQVKALDRENGWPSPHPHVNWNNIPCLGSQAEMICLYEPFILVQGIANMMAGEITQGDEYYYMGNYVPWEYCASCYVKVAVSQAEEEGGLFYHPDCLEYKKKEITDNAGIKEA